MARTCSLIFIVLDVLKPLQHKRLIEKELEGFGIRYNYYPNTGHLNTGNIWIPDFLCPDRYWFYLATRGGSVLLNSMNGFDKMLKKIQWGSKNEPYKIRKHKKSGLSEDPISNDTVFKGWRYSYGPDNLKPWSFEIQMYTQAHWACLIVSTLSSRSLSHTCHPVPY